jgi:hypothetical protein
VAIIGAGPCGLTAAQDLALAGYGVTVFEAMPVAGGMLRLGVPEYRLPAPIIEREVQDIVDLGIDLRLNHQVNNLDDLFAEGFDAVLIAVGAHEGIRLPIPGADLDGVLVNTHFLRDVRLGKYARGEPEQPLGSASWSSAVATWPSTVPAAPSVWARSPSRLPGEPRGDAGPRLGSRGCRSRRGGAPPIAYLRRDRLPDGNGGVAV